MQTAAVSRRRLSLSALQLLRPQPTCCLHWPTHARSPDNYWRTTGVYAMIVPKIKHKFQRTSILCYKYNTFSVTTCLHLIVCILTFCIFNVFTDLNATRNVNRWPSPRLSSSQRLIFQTKKRFDKELIMIIAYYKLICVPASRMCRVLCYSVLLLSKCNEYNTKCSYCGTLKVFTNISEAKHTFKQTKPISDCFCLFVCFVLDCFVLFLVW